MSNDTPSPSLDGMGGGQGPSLLRNGLYNVGGATVRGAVGLLTIPFLIRFLGIREYGVWSLVYAVFALMTMSEAGISVAASVFLSKDLARNDFREAGRTLTFILSSAVLLSAALGVFLWNVGPLIVRPLSAFGIAERADAGHALQIAGFAVSAFILQRTLVGVEQAFNRYAAINALELCQSVLANVGLVVVAWLGGRTIDMMKWQVFVCALLLAAHCGVVLWLLRSKGLRFEWSKSKARQIFRYNLATWTATLGSAAFGQCDRFIVGGVLGAPVLGIYSAIINITSKINSFSATAVQPLVPSLSRDLVLDAPVEGRIRQATHVNALIAIEAGIFLYVLADWVMQVLAPGATAREHILGLKIAAIIYALYSLNAPGFYILFSVGGARTNAAVTLSSGVVSLALILMGARYFGLLGALAGNAGYLGTFLLVVAGLRKTGIALSRYLQWMAFPLLWLAIALIAGTMLQGHLLWQTVFVIVQAALLILWFLRDHGKAPGIVFGIGRPSES
ncbi:MAG: rane protein involved in the export of O-antigen and teichoic acid [Candidatus Acidoferrum typicum]|nr:rane protein involved in the export of O-antigen and teichoic acid [Candidatus Acidoferrum typicum]